MTTQPTALCRHQGRLIESEHEVTIRKGTPDTPGDIKDQYTVEVYECDQYGKCTPKRRGPADAAICAGCRLFHAIGDESRIPEKPRKPGNWRKIPGRRVFDLAGLAKKESDQLTAEVEACPHRGEQIDTRLCNVCGGEKGQPFPVYACRLHGECSVSRKRTDLRDCRACIIREENRDVHQENADGNR